MSTIRLMSLATGCMCILMFIIMVTFLIVVIGKSVNELYLICMLGCVPIGIGCIVAAYMDGDY